MAKTKAQKRKNESKEGPLKRIKTIPLTPPSDDITDTTRPTSLAQVGLATEDLELAVDTLNTLARNPGVIKSKQCKDLRTAVYEFRHACTTGFNSSGGLRASVDSNANLTARISGALADGGYVEARILLAEMRIRGQRPKLGALCRWVRDLDVVSGLAEQIAGARRGEKEEELLGVLDAVLRVLGEVDYSAIPAGAEPGSLNIRPVWNLRADGMERRRVYDAVLDGTIYGVVGKDIKTKFRTIETTPGPARKPPNHHPAILWASRDDAILLEPQTTKAMAYKHEIVPNLHLLKDVLSSKECEQIIAAAESIGFTPDAPIRAEGEEISVLAHNFYWIVDTEFCSKLWERVAHMVPAQVGGKKVRGINRRFRVYRYVPGAEYRAHIDGAWPPSSIDPVTDTYIYDSSPPTARQSSLFTFLIYLNDEFEGGETTYFLPSAKEGTMNAYSIQPVQGSVAMFPHGETEGSLLHEGTGVREGSGRSAKYVIRTDVLYDLDT